MGLAYKVCARRGETHVSFITSHKESEVEYALGEWSFAPERFFREGYGLLAFNNMSKAQGWTGKHADVFVCDTRFPMELPRLARSNALSVIYPKEWPDASGFGWPTDTEMFGAMKPIATVTGATLCYKTVARRKSGDLASCIATGVTEMTYRIGEVAQVAPHMATAGLFPLVFGDLKSARHFSSHYLIYLAACWDEVFLPSLVPHHRWRHDLRPYYKAKMQSVEWPPGTMMYKKVMLLELAYGGLV